MLFNLKFIYLVVANFGASVLAKNHGNIKLNYLMTPKHESLHLLSELFLKDHNVNSLAKFNDYSIYNVDPENYIKYKSTFNRLFHVERDQMIYLNYIDSDSSSNKFKIQ